MDIAIKILGPGDRAVLDGVSPDVFDDAVDARLAAEFLDDQRHHLVVAIEADQVVGMASAVHYVHPDKPAQLWINEVGVASSHHGRGIGKALVRELLQHGERLGCTEAWVLTDRTNEAAMRLYAAAGGRLAPGDTVMFEFALNPANAGTTRPHRWYARPVFFVSDVHRAARFYIDMLGFEKAWHEADGAGTVCQVNRGECEIILAQEPARAGKARLFVELTADGLADFRRELAERSVPNQQSWWGYDVIQIFDPDGNELLFPFHD